MMYVYWDLEWWKLAFAEQIDFYEKVFDSLYEEEDFWVVSNFNFYFFFWKLDALMILI